MQKRFIFFFLLMFLASGVFGFELDRTHVMIQAKIYPQLIFFTSKAKELPHNKPIVIGAVYSGSGKRAAEIFKEECEKLYKNGLKGYDIDVRLISKDMLYSEPSISLYYVIFEGDDDFDIAKSQKLKGALTFAGNKRVFEKNGAMFFVEITNKTSILLNKRTISQSGVSFDSSLLKIVKVYE